MLKDIALLIQVAVAILSIVLYKKFSTSFYRVLVLILSISVLVEFWGHYIGSEQIVWTVYTIFIFILIYILFIQVLIDKLALKISKVVFCFFLVVSVIVLFDVSFFYRLLILGSINTSLLSFFYLRQLLLSDEILNYKKLLPFWISVGFLVFYLPSIPFFSMLNYMQTRGLFFVIQVLIILMNLIIGFGLIWSKEEKY